MANSYSLEELIEMLDDVLNKATRVPMSKKSMVDVDALADIVDDMRIALPVDIQQAQKVVMDKNNIIAEAKREAENIIRKAEQRRAELLDENDIVKEARRRATEMVNAEQSYCADLRASTDNYIVNMLSRVEELLSGDLNHLSVLRANITGASGSSPQQASVQPMAKPGE